MGGVIVLGVAALYVAILIAQGEALSRGSVLWAAALVTVGLAGVVSSFLRGDRRRLVVFAASAFVMFVIGVLTLFSIGGLLVVALLLFAIAAWDTYIGTASAGR